MRAQVKIVIKVFKPKVSGVNMTILDVSLDHLAVSPHKLPVDGFNPFIGQIGSFPQAGVEVSPPI